MYSRAFSSGSQVCVLHRDIDAIPKVWGWEGHLPQLTLAPFEWTRRASWKWGLRTGAIQSFAPLPGRARGWAETVLPCPQLGWTRRCFPLQKREKDAFHSPGASHQQPSVLRKIDDVGSCSHPASFERKDSLFLVSSENEGPGRLEKLAQGHVGGGSNPVSVCFRTLCRHYLYLQLCSWLVDVTAHWFALSTDVKAQV